MTPSELTRLLELHRRFVTGLREGARANLSSKNLAGATLDVFRTEPLPPEHPFWAHRKIIITPHTSRKSRPENVAPQVADSIRRLRAGQPLSQIVDRTAGY
jgi:glyoxylate/hydroxypyruvate reductase A